MSGLSSDIHGKGTARSGSEQLRWTESLLDAVSIEPYCTKSAREKKRDREPEHQFQTLASCFSDMLSSVSLRAFAIVVPSVQIAQPFLLS